MVDLTLGTVQLGMNYGVANSAGQPDFYTAKEILRTALEGGVEWLDTAIAYGESEVIVGKSLQDLDQSCSKQPKIVTKFPSLKNYSLDEMDELLDSSLLNLHRECIEGLLLHDPMDLTNGESVKLEHFFNYRNTCKVENVGVSVYSPGQAMHAIQNYEIDMIQFQSNLFDRSFLEAGVFEVCKKKSIKVFVRSIFLQGLFFLSPDSPKVRKIRGAFEALKVLQEFCAQNGCSIPELCFADATRFTNASIIVGAELPYQVEQNFQNVIQSQKVLGLLSEWDKIRPSVTNELTNPALWDQ